MSAYADKVFEMLVQGTPIAKAWEHAQSEKWTVTRPEFDADVQQAFETLTVKGNPDPEVERGRAVERLHRLWFATMRIQDFKAALQVQREINALVGLRQKPGSRQSAQQLLAASATKAKTKLKGTANGRKR